MNTISERALLVLISTGEQDHIGYCILHNNIFQIHLLTLISKFSSPIFNLKYVRQPRLEHWNGKTLKYLEFLNTSWASRLTLKQLLNSHMT